ncbi:unnamed protein product [Rodentolepis nana]|uniref:Uncharacterized protein n=1 Tax=Rodentolepis nana TaxID=102285 RepID=A0A0R3TRT2_RODNA|nr:unnamed protein product [Rodentolepis nana]
MQYHRPPLIGSNFQPNLRPLPLPNPIHHHRETPMATNKPSSSNLEDLNIYGQSTMIEGGLLEFCRPPPKQLQFKPVRPLSSQLQPFWGANGSIVFVDARAKLFYTPAQVRELYRDRPHSPMRTTFRPPNQPPPRQPPRPPWFVQAAIYVNTDAN